MEEFLKQLLGENTIHIWSAGMIWAFIGIVIVKLWYIRSKFVETKNFTTEKWSWGKYFRHNIIDILMGIILGMIILRLGDYAFGLVEKFGYDLGKTEDFVAFMIPISGYAQVWLHKKRPKIKKDDDTTN